MKKFILFLMAAVLLSGSCGVTESRAERQAREAREAQAVREKINSRHFTVVVNTMLPLRGASKFLNGDYGVTVDGEKFVSFLPYFGQARSLPYGGGSGLHFEAEVGAYSVQETRPGVYDVNIHVSTSEDTFLYMFRIYDNGNSSLQVQSRNRDQISFTGTMDLTGE